MARLVLDASVVIGFLDPADRHHRAAVSTLSAARDDDLLVPASVYAEVLVHPQRVGTSAVSHVERTLAELPSTVVPITSEIARRASFLRAHHGSLQLGDALVIATAEILDAAALTADRRWRDISRRARVI